MTQITLPFVPPLSPSKKVFLLMMSSQPAHFPLSIVLCVLRCWAPLLQHKIAKQSAHTPYPNFLRGLNWKIVEVIFLPANTPSGWSGSIWSPDLLEGNTSSLGISCLTITPAQSLSFISHYWTLGILLPNPLNCGLIPGMNTENRPLWDPHSHRYTAVSKKCSWCAP